ncbi:hypothetical protein [Methylophilus sp. UBA6697]|jgi:hypothetical protein|uniref:hypothetical protein n=1 Tax=Methylophilus sp. UBA6697 TaxID=1946902 RepID=UPI0025FC67B7|nr:hypothetical protein [Methylophilus sp. UBA6697]
MGVSRQELYDQAWSEPITKVAKRHDVSDSYLVRVLKRLNIPRPPTGYWAKLASGKATPPRPARPDALLGDELEWCREYEPATHLPFELPKNTSGEPVSKSSKEKNTNTQHPLLTESLGYFQGVPESEMGYLKPIKKEFAGLYSYQSNLRSHIQTGQ